MIERERQYGLGSPSVNMNRNEVEQGKNKSVLPTVFAVFGALIGIYVFPDDLGKVVLITLFSASIGSFFEVHGKKLLGKTRTLPLSSANVSNQGDFLPTNNFSSEGIMRAKVKQKVIATLIFGTVCVIDHGSSRVGAHSALRVEVLPKELERKRTVEEERVSVAEMIRDLVSPSLKIIDNDQTCFVVSKWVPRNLFNKNLAEIGSKVLDELFMLKAAAEKRVHGLKLEIVHDEELLKLLGFEIELFNIQKNKAYRQREQSLTLAPEQETESLEEVEEEKGEGEEMLTSIPVQDPEELEEEGKKGEDVEEGEGGMFQDD
ncbi:MAG: hypothetical protein Q6362_005800 [Candidatus Wukongarchaeota archaeon]|nr:hypothetical protein [Candidatus Wukongarchaeota archaeon]